MRRPATAASPTAGSVSSGSSPVALPPLDKQPFAHDNAFGRASLASDAARSAI